jgi:hypothetical protein
MSDVLCLLVEKSIIFNTAQGMWHLQIIDKYRFERMSTYQLTLGAHVSRAGPGSVERVITEFCTTKFQPKFVDKFWYLKEWQFCRGGGGGGVK